MSENNLGLNEPKLRCWQNWNVLKTLGENMFPLLSSASRSPNISSVPLFHLHEQQDESVLLMLTSLVLFTSLPHLTGILLNFIRTTGIIQKSNPSSCRWLGRFEPHR